MRRLWHTPARFLLILRTVVPLYVSYFWLWAKKKWFGKKTPPEVWSRVHTKNAKRFYKLAVRMRGGLIKVGQIISTRVDIVPPEWSECLAGLQDRVDPTPWKVIEARLTKELGAPPQEVFDAVENEAVAAASFGQVHRATTKDGREVALKIQYEDVRMKLECDLFVLRCAVPLFNIFVPKVRLRVIYDEVRKALETELDYRQEAEYTRLIRANLEDVSDVFVPEVLDRYTTEFVICTSYFPGFKITDRDKLGQEGLETLDLIRTVIRAYACMFFVDGVFQSDPHPGNLLVRKGASGRAELCILDFGQVKILPRQFQRKIVHSSVAFMGRDVDNFAKSVVEMGVLSERDAEIAKPILTEFFEEMFEMTPNDLKQLDVEVMKEKIQGVIKQIEGVTIPQDIVLYGRAFSLLAGVIAALDPDVNGIIVAKPMIMEALMRPENFMPLPEETAVSEGAAPSTISA
ncbi:MAG: AarF/UbiB family protein [Myxococcota bacterium]